MIGRIEIKENGKQIKTKYIQSKTNKSRRQRSWNRKSKGGIITQSQQKPHLS